VDIVSISFVNLSPEHDPTGEYAGTNFAGHCGGDYYVKGATTSNLIKDCTSIKEDIPYCQAKGVKILLAIGGVYTPGGSSDYSLSSEAKGEEFADFLWKAFGPYNLASFNDYPRPFDINSTHHNCVDGFDFDVEHKFGTCRYG
jgi:chitinase